MGVNPKVDMTGKLSQLEKALAVSFGGMMVAAGIAVGTLSGVPARAEERVTQTWLSSGANGSSNARSNAQDWSIALINDSAISSWDRELYSRAADLQQMSRKSNKDSAKQKKRAQKKAPQEASVEPIEKPTPTYVSTPPPSSAGSQAEKVWDLLIAEGLSPTAAAGILGNLQQESNVDPTAVQGDGPGVGLAQWSRGGRWDTGPKSLLAFANDGELNPWSVKTQIEFVMYEMEYGDLGFDLEYYQGITDVVTAAEYFHDVFERSADTPDYVTKVRGGYAKEWLALLG